MAKEKKLSPAKQKIMANYEEQKCSFRAAGYGERQEVISVLKANIMAFVTAGPFVILCTLIWILSGKGTEGTFGMGSMIGFLLLILVSIFVHELLHGVGWVIWTKKKWESIYLGMMWEYLTPYCHCKEPLKPRQYLVGGLAPFMVLGIGGFLVALVTGNHMIFWLSMVNILSAGGDTTLMCMMMKYMNKQDCYILDHPTDCGFVAFLKSTE